MYVSLPQEDESVIKRRLEDDQNRPVDIMSLPDPPTALLLNAPPSADGYEHFLRQYPDDDQDEGFYPPPELLEWYEPEEIVGAPAAPAPPTPLPIEGEMDEGAMTPYEQAVVDIKVKRKRSRR